MRCSERRRAIALRLQSDGLVAAVAELWLLSRLQL
ncbi:MAG: hypothetical protein JWR26_2386 [Pedosphaera sp.]|nr:hypothetical protein [Pedosphaera sp.]